MSPVRRWVMAGLRTVFLWLLLALLLRPVLAVTVAGSVRQSLALLIDTSRSMGIRDVREAEVDIRRAGIALGTGWRGAGAAGAAGTKYPARIEVVRGALGNPQLELWRRLTRDFQLGVFTFDRQVSDLAVSSLGGGESGNTEAWMAGLKAEGGATSLGDAIREVIAARRGQAPAGIVVISDGASNSGLPLQEAAHLAQAENIPLYCYGVGITTPKDIIVSDILAPEIAFVRDELPLSVRVRAQGMKGQRGKLTLKANDKVVDTAEVTFGEDGEQLVRMRFTPEHKGELSLVASIPPRADEVVQDNNESPAQPLRVVDGRIKVLHIEQTPRWDFKYLQALLMRDRRVDYRCWLQEADPGIAVAASGTGEAGGAGGGGWENPYITQFPGPRAELFKFDLVILGDIDPRSLTVAQMQALNDFVANFGGAMIMVAGKNFSPQGFRRTPIEKMLPVEFEGGIPGGLGEAGDVFDKPLRMQLTPVGRGHPLMQLGATEAESARRWERIPSIFWTARVLRPKPAAEVLLVDADSSKASRFGKMPVLALQQYGMGQVLYVGTDNTWRWRKNQGSDMFTQLWSQIIERMSIPHMMGLSKRTQLAADRRKYAPGERVTIYARLYDEKNFEPLNVPTVAGTLNLRGAGAGGGGRAVTLRQLPDQPGMYRAEFMVPAEAGNFQFKVASDAGTTLDLLVAESKLELNETALNESGLRELAQLSGGGFYREEDLSRLPEQIRHTAQPVLSSYDVEFWSSPLYFLALVLAAGAEWWLRKRAQLK